MTAPEQPASFTEPGHPLSWSKRPTNTDHSARGALPASSLDGHLVQPVQRALPPPRSLNGLQERPAEAPLSLNGHFANVRPPIGRGDSPVKPMPPLTPEHMAERLRRPIPPLLSNDPLDPEIYRLIYAGLSFPCEAPVTLLGVASAVRGEGCSTIALGLATTLAVDLDVRITLVEADLERPCLSEVLHVAPSPGLAAVLREEHEPHEVVREIPTRSGSLSLIPAGSAGQNAGPLLRRMAEHDPFRGAKGLEGLVIMDLPPLVSSSLGPLAARLADVTVLVVRAGVTPHRLVREAIARLDDRPPQGVVLNAFRSAIPRWWPTWPW